MTLEEDVLALGVLDFWEQISRQDAKP